MLQTSRLTFTICNKIIATGCHARIDGFMGCKPRRNSEGEHRPEYKAIQASVTFSIRGILAEKFAPSVTSSLVLVLGKLHVVVEFEWCA